MQVKKSNQILNFLLHKNLNLNLYCFQLDRLYFTKTHGNDHYHEFETSTASNGGSLFSLKISYQNNARKILKNGILVEIVVDSGPILDY